MKCAAHQIFHYMSLHQVHAIKRRIKQYKIDSSLTYFVHIICHWRVFLVNLRSTEEKAMIKCFLLPCMGLNNYQLLYFFSFLIWWGFLGSTGPYLQEDILSLKELHAANDQGQQSEPLVQSEPEPAVAIQPPPVEQRKPAEKKLVKPKWLKMWFQFLLDSVIIVQKRTFTFLVGQRYIWIQRIMQSPQEYIIVNFLFFLLHFVNLYIVFDASVS